MVLFFSSRHTFHILLQALLYLDFPLLCYLAMVSHVYSTDYSYKEILGKRSILTFFLKSTVYFLLQ